MEDALLGRGNAVRWLSFQFENNFCEMDAQVFLRLWRFNYGWKVHCKRNRLNIRIILTQNDN